MFSTAAKNEPMPVEDQTMISTPALKFVSPRKPASMQAAENTLRVARQAREKVYADFIDAVREYQVTNGRSGSSKLNRLDAELKEADTKVREVRFALNSQREAFRPTYFRAVKNLVAEASNEISESLTVLSSVADALAEAQKFAEANALDTPRVISNARLLRRLIGEFSAVAGVTSKAPK